jgi:hypothetical protein
MSVNPILTAAQNYVQVGLSVIPVSVKTKTPTVKWKVFQNRLPTDNELKKGFAQAAGLAVVCGAVSGNLEILDFDLKAELFPNWQRLVEEEAPGLLSRLAIQKSQNQGRHAFYRCPALPIPGNKTFAQRPIDVGVDVQKMLLERRVNLDDEVSVKQALKSLEVLYGGKGYQPRLVNSKFIIVITLVETRGEGGYFLAHPTPGYELLQGDFLHIPTITPEERQILITAAIALNEYVDPGKIEGFGYRLSKETRRPGDDFNERGDATAVLAKHGWEPVGARGAFQHYRRPGKDRGQSASLIDSKLFHVFSTNAYPFESETTYAPFAVYTYLEFDGDFVRAAAELAKLGFGKSSQPGTATQNSKTVEANWDLAARLFPRLPFPWKVLPAEIAESLKQLGRACATSPYALPGAGFCLMSSILGRTRAVSPKNGWDAPMTIWHMDIRESGEGKTPPVRLMAGPIHEAQKEEEKRYQKEQENYERLKPKDQKEEPKPQPARGYFVSDLTLEGLREDLVNSPHGGIVVIQDEISAFLTGQNQYKQKGTDREAWLALFDGHPARIKRVGRSFFIHGARVSIFGGVQPKVFKTFFAGEDGLYLSDGTLFRFLATFEPASCYELTAESWEDCHRDQWEKLLFRALDWVEGEIYAHGGSIEKPVLMILDAAAQEKFFDWRNQLVSFKDRLPAQLRGFLPKAIEYALRLAGVIHCMRMFSRGETPQIVLTLEDLERGIKAVQFYLGQIQDALRLIEHEGHTPVEVSERSLLVAQTLEWLRPHIENGRLAISFTQEQYNRIAPETQKIRTARAMGSLLRTVGLTTTPGKHYANGRRAARCLEWDKNTETFIKQSLQRLQQDETQEWRDFDGADVEEPMSASSAETERYEDIADNGETMSASKTCTNTDQTAFADIADDIREVQF